MHRTTNELTRRTRAQSGQTTAEYALVLLGVAAVALAFITWAGGGHIGHFLDTIFERLVATGK